MPRTFRRALTAAAIVAACTLAMRADTKGDAELQFQLGQPAVRRDAVPRSAAGLRPGDRGGRARARAPRAQGQGARGAAHRGVRHGAGRSASACAPTAPPTPRRSRSTATPCGRPACSTNPIAPTATPWRSRPSSSRARFGIARSLATRNRLDEALDEALAAVATAPRDGEIHATIGDIYERLNRFDEAANSYNNYINLLPNKDRSEKAAWSRAQVRFFEAFEGMTPVEIDEDDRRDAAHGAVQAGEGQDRRPGAR